MNRRNAIVAAATVIAVLSGPVIPSALAQARGERPGRAGQQPPPPEGVSPGEIQQMFDAYVLMQAQEVLQLRDDQYAQFLTRLRALQTVRRRAENQRMQNINQLRRLLNQPDGKLDEAMVKERLKALSESGATVASEIRQAQDSLDEVLDLRQQARFRILEEEMERRKAELVMRTRQANRPQPNRPRNPPSPQ